MVAKTSQNHLGLFALFALVALWWATTNPSHPKFEDYKVQNIGLDQAKALIDSGALVLDVRGQAKYDHRHIPGAVLVPLEDLRKEIPATIVQAKNRDILVYCNEGVSHGPEATYILNQAGFSRAVNLQPGIEGWANAGLPIAK